MNIQGFLGSFQDLARSNLFEIQISRLDGFKLRFHVKTASLPGSTIEPIKVPYMGRQIAIPGDRIYEDWQVSVMLDKTYSIRQQLFDWHESINATVGNVGPSSVASIKSDGLVRAVNKDGSTGQIYQFRGMFPSIVGPIEFSKDNANTIAECQATFAYDFYQAG